MRSEAVGYLPRFALERTVVEANEDDKPREACGVIGIYNPNDPTKTADMVLAGLGALQHRGQDAAGIGVVGADGNIMIEKNSGRVDQVFSGPQSTAGFGEGVVASGHVRYGTTEAIDGFEAAQPYIVELEPGYELTLAHNGHITNIAELKLSFGQSADKLHSDSQVALALIADHYRRISEPDYNNPAASEGQRLRRAVEAACEKLEGAFSLVLTSSRGELLAARDSHGFRPLVAGELKGGGWVVASESVALDDLQATAQFDVQPGEIIYVSSSGQLEQEATPTGRQSLCAMELVYFARPDSKIDDVSIVLYRQALGERLATIDTEQGLEADVVIGVPDSGVPAAEGYALSTGLPFSASSLIKNRYITRSFIDPSQEEREVKVRRKFHPQPALLRGKRIVLVDDSIVRGTTTKALTKMLRSAGVAEIHLRITSPPYKWPCFYGIATGDPEQLMARAMAPDQMAAELGVDSLSFLSPADLQQAAGRMAGSLCLACFTGNYPTLIPTNDQSSQLEVVVDVADRQPKSSVCVSLVDVS